ncbi:HupE/UreJ family protein [Acinetobacter sp. MD2]|uniref:HupE/UreJ family protein n=1 Tax=Acinetobacter sp. MD2 TaxID=2600066 RepID=UPI002D1E719C|nr:HupE/UreJ family protein [Acinetobacter sp. MD2]MEB3767774.1 HupE/UreJ family protein [Acinetobacter sp. MD2]
MQKINKVFIALLAGLPAVAMAHPGHEFPELGFLSGFFHPFTGLDHMSMAVGLGVLLYNAKQRWQLTGLLGLAFSLMLGFIVGTQNWLASSAAEYGIVASLLFLAYTLWRKQESLLPMATVSLAVFHGMAHGTELSGHGHWAALMLGMVSAMAILYAAGLGLGALLQRFLPQQGRKIVAALVALVGFIGLA